MATNFVIYIFLFYISQAAAFIQIGAVGGWRFGSGVFFEATFYAILAVFGFRFMTDWLYIKPKSFVILGCMTILPDFGLRLILTIVALAQGNPLREAWVIWSSGVHLLLLELAVFAIDMVCAIQTIRENKELKSNSTT